MGYDGWERVASVSTDFATGTDATDNFEYDDTGRIESWGRTGFGSGDAAYVFDDAGNLTSKARDGDVTDYAYNEGNQLTTETAGSVETTHAYDEFGRLVRSASPSSVTTYTWDALGHLSRVASEGVSATYEYGISGMRERKTVVTGEGTSSTKSVWAGMQLVAELDSDGTRYEYVYGGGIPLELIVTAGGTTSCYAYQVDAGGSVIGITDENGTEVARYAYDPYGVPTTLPTPGSLADRNPLRYRGYYFDTETGNYYMPARYYEPESARFLSVDPAPPKAGDPVTINRYAYCLGDPVSLFDPTGALADYNGDGKQDAVDYYANLYEDTGDESYLHAATAAHGAKRATGSNKTNPATGSSAKASQAGKAALYLLGANCSVQYSISTAVAGAVASYWYEGPPPVGVSATEYDDINVSVGLFSLGVIMNHYSDGSTNALFYAGRSYGLPGVSWSGGWGSTERGIAIEIGAFAVLGGALGLHSDVTGPKTDLTPYWQAGYGSPQAGISAIYIWDWDVPFF